MLTPILHSPSFSPNSFSAASMKSSSRPRRRGSLSSDSSQEASCAVFWSAPSCFSSRHSSRDSISPYTTSSSSSGSQCLPHSHSLSQGSSTASTQNPWTPSTSYRPSCSRRSSTSAASSTPSTRFLHGRRALPTSIPFFISSTASATDSSVSPLFLFGFPLPSWGGWYASS